MRTFLRWVLPVIGSFLAAAVVAWAADNAVVITAGSGVQMKSKDVGAGAQAMQNLLCDPSTVAQCAAVSAGGAVSVAGAVTNAGTFATQVNGFTSWAGGTLGAMANFGTTPGAVLVPGVNASVIASALPSGAATSANQSTEISSLATIATNTGSSIPAGSALIGSVGIDQTTPGTTNLVQSSKDPCTYQAKTSVPFSTAAGNTQIISGVSAKKIYVCSFAMIVPSAVAVSLIEGAAAQTCVTSMASVLGQPGSAVSAPALGMSLAANGGLTLGNGSGTVAQTATAANGLCLFQSGTAQIAGNLTFVQQ